jgi:pimeloyl-ACP methyl ester carboxylesterase
MIVTAGSVKIAYDRTGSGPPVVLLHGCTEDRRIFDRLVPGLASRFTVYAMDSRNHGESEMTGDFSYSPMAGDLLAFMDALSITPAWAVGFSDGAIVALMAAMRRPSAFRGIALLSVNLKVSDLTEEGTGFLKKLYAETSDPRLANLFVEPDIELADAAALDMPVLVAGAENDIIRPGLFPELASALPKGELLMMKGHDHTSYVVDRDILLPDLLRFFS